MAYYYDATWHNGACIYFYYNALLYTNIHWLKDNHFFLEQ